MPTSWTGMRAVIPGAQGLGRPRAALAHGVCALILCLGLLAPVPGLAQDTATTEAPAEPQLSPEEVVALADEGDRLLREGDMDASWEAIAKANDATFTYEYEPLVKHYPNLIFARYYYRAQDWVATENFASSVATVLDEPTYVDHPYRLEALVLDGIALYWQNRNSEAEAILRSATIASLDRKEILQIHLLGTFYASRALTELGSPDAQMYRDHFLEVFVPGDLVTNADWAYIVYLNIDEDRLNGKDLDTLIQRVQRLIEGAEKEEDFDAVFLSFLKGFQGLLYAENGEYDKAQPIFEERHAWLTEQDRIDIDFWWNVQRLGMTYSVRGKSAQGFAFLTGLLPLARKVELRPYMMHILYRDLGLFSSEIGRVDLSQQYYRDAYAMLRKIRRADDPEVVEIASKIDLSDPGAQGFGFSEELGGGADLELELAADGSDTLRLFFSGRYLALGSRFAAIEAEGAQYRTEFYINRALYRALTGAYDDCFADLRLARDMARSKSSAIRPDAVIFDLIEAIATIWTTQHEVWKSGYVADLLDERLDDMTPAEKDLALALIAYQAFQSAHPDLIPSRFETWQTHHQTLEAVTPISIFTEAIAYELSEGRLPPERTSALFDGVNEKITASGEYSLMAHYLRMYRLFLDPNMVYNDDLITEFSVLVADISRAVPGDHRLLYDAQFGLGSALIYLERFDESIQWFDASIEGMRGSRYRPIDALAYVLSQEAVALSRMGEDSRAAAIAKEAYTMLDFASARQNLASAIIDVYASMVWSRSGSASLASAIYKKHIEDEAYFNGIEAQYRVSLLRNYAETLRVSGQPEEALKLLERAAAEIPEDVRDRRWDKSNVEWNRAMAYWDLQNWDAAWSAIRTSNDLVAAYRNDILARGAADTIGASEKSNRAAWEAAIGWEYAANLPADGAATP